MATGDNFHQEVEVCRIQSLTVRATAWSGRRCGCTTARSRRSSTHHLRRSKRCLQGKAVAADTYCTIPYHTILYFTLLHYSVPGTYYAIPHNLILQNISDYVLYHRMLAALLFRPPIPPRPPRLRQRLWSLPATARRAGRPKGRKLQPQLSILQCIVVYYGILKSTTGTVSKVYWSILQYLIV